MIRKDGFEVPYIAFYRKETIENWIPINDLWRILSWDEKWVQLYARKTKLVELFRRMQAYIAAMREAGVEVRLPRRHLHVEQVDSAELTDACVDAVNECRSMEDLSDVYAEFQLYHGANTSKMLAYEQALAQATNDDEQAALQVGAA